MQSINDIVPLAKYLGLKADDIGLNLYLAAFGKKPAFKIVEYTADLSYKKSGFSLSFIQEEWTVKEGKAFTKDAFILRGFFLYSNGYEGFDQYKGPLPEKLAFFDHRAMVKVKLGEPYSTTGGNKFGKIVFPLRDEYRLETCSMAISYQNEKVIMVDFMTLREVERLSRK